MCGCMWVNVFVWGVCVLGVVNVCVGCTCGEGNNLEVRVCSMYGARVMGVCVGSV